MRTKRWAEPDALLSRCRSETRAQTLRCGCHCCEHRLHGMTGCFRPAEAVVREQAHGTSGCGRREGGREREREGSHSHVINVLEQSLYDLSPCLLPLSLPFQTPRIPCSLSPLKRYTVFCCCRSYPATAPMLTLSLEKRGKKENAPSRSFFSSFLWRSAFLSSSSRSSIFRCRRWVPLSFGTALFTVPVIRQIPVKDFVRMHLCRL